MWVAFGFACCLLVAPRPVCLYCLLPDMLAHHTAVHSEYPEDTRRHLLYRNLVPSANRNSRQEIEENWHTVFAESPEHCDIGPVDRDGSGGKSYCIPD